MSNTQRQSLDFLNRCTAVSVQRHSLSFSKKLPAAAIRTDSDPTRVTGTKKLLDCPEAKAIQTEFNRIAAFVKSRSLPTPFGEGIYFVPNTRLEEVDAELLMTKTTNIPRLVESLCAVYADVLVREQTELGPNYNPADYDTPSEIRDRVNLDFSYVTFGVPENLPDVIRQREAEKQGQRLMESVDAMQLLVQTEMAKLVSHAVDALTGTKDGKPKIFRDSLVNNIREFLDLFKDRNITNDTQMEALCARASQLLEGVDPADLRDTNKPLRDTVAQGFAQIQTQLESMMVERGTRRILFDDDAPAAGEATPAPAAEPATVEPEPVAA